MTLVKRLDLSDVSLAYQEAGAGRPLVCIHGNFASKRWFKEQLQAPIAGWRVIALDLPNFGESAALPTEISIAAYATYLQAFIAGLELSSATLLGHSLGGAVAQAYAARHPQTLSGLILLSSAPPSGLKTPEEQYPLLESLKGNAELMRQALAPTMALGQPAYFEDLVQDALVMQPAAYSGNARALEVFNVSADLSAVTCPVLVLRGALDYLISEAMARETTSAFTQAQLKLLDGIGHSPQVEDPPRFNKILHDFLEGLP